MPDPAGYVQFSSGDPEALDYDAGGGVYVSQGTTLTCNTGAVATGDDCSTALEGAQEGLLVDYSPVTVNDGTFTGGNGLAGFGGAAAGIKVTGGNGAVFGTYANVAVHGGSFNGGDDDDNGAGGGLFVSPDALAIDGGTFTGGASSSGFGGAGIGIALSGSVAGTVSSGTFTPGVGGSATGLNWLAAKDTASLTISGGSWGPVVNLYLADSASIVFTGSGLSYSGGFLTGTLSDSTVISIAITSNSPSLSSSGSGSSITFTA